MNDTHEVNNQVPDETLWECGCGLAELALESFADTNLRQFLSTITSPNAASCVAQVLREYTRIASTPIRVRRGSREFKIKCIKADNNRSEILNQTEWNQYFVPLIVDRDFGVLKDSLREIGRKAASLGLNWEHTSAILNRLADRLARLDVNSEGPEQQVAEMNGVLNVRKRSTIGLSLMRAERDPNVAARRTELENVLRQKPKASAREICIRWDFKNLKVPAHWQDEGIRQWVRWNVKHCVPPADSSHYFGNTHQ